MDIYKQYDTKKYKINEERLNNLKGKHPQLFFSDKESFVKKASDPQLKFYWDATLNKADKICMTTPPPKIDDDKNHDEHWNLSYKMPVLAISYVMTGNKKYLDNSIIWLNSALACDDWGKIPDIATAHECMGVSLAYDWLYDELSEEMKEQIEERLYIECKKIYDCAATEEKFIWNHEILQNHMWITLAGAAAGAIMLLDKKPEVKKWLSKVVLNYSTFLSVLADDGAFHEGVEYWFYSFESVLMFMHIADENLGVNMFDSRWFKNAAGFVLNLFIPRNSWSPYEQYMPISDCYFRGGSKSALINCLAARYNDGCAKWFANQIDDENMSVYRYNFLNLIWTDPNIKAIPPKDKYPTLMHYENLDYVFSRSSWEGDESLLALRCGPYLGHKEWEINQLDVYDDWGGGHVHPDCNHFTLYGCGQFLMDDDSYSVPKWTEYHNTLLVDGKGQMGEGLDWFLADEQHFDKPLPHIIKAESNKEYDHIIGSAGDIYKGLNKFERHFVFLKPNCLIIIDDIEAIKESELELRLWPHSQNIYRTAENVFDIKGEKAALRIELLTDWQVETELCAQKIMSRAFLESKSVIKYKKKAKKWKNVVALTWCEADKLPDAVEWKRFADSFSFGMVTVDLGEPKKEINCLKGLGNIPIKSVTESGSFEANNCIRTLDDKYNTFWKTDDEGQYVEYELYGEHTINAILLDFLNSVKLSYGFSIEFLSDDWKLVYKGNSKKTEGFEFVKIPDTVAKAVRITVFGSDMPKSSAAICAAGFLEGEGYIADIKFKHENNFMTIGDTKKLEICAYSETGEEIILDEIDYKSSNSLVAECEDGYLSVNNEGIFVLSGSVKSKGQEFTVYKRLEAVNYRVIVQASCTGTSNESYDNGILLGIRDDFSVVSLNFDLADKAENLESAIFRVRTVASIEFFDINRITINLLLEDGTQIGEFTCGTEWCWHEVDITDYVRGKNKLGLKLQIATPKGYIIINSAKSNDKPQIVIK